MNPETEARVCRQCARVTKPGIPHVCKDADVLAHHLNISRKLILQAGTTGEKVFYKKFFNKRKKVS